LEAALLYRSYLPGSFIQNTGVASPIWDYNLKLCRAFAVCWSFESPDVLVDDGLALQGLYCGCAVDVL
jgi:hypothetical protein